MKEETFTADIGHRSLEYTQEEHAPSRQTQFPTRLMIKPEKGLQYVAQ